MPAKNHNLFLCNDSTLTSMQRLLKEKNRLSISDDQMAKILGVPEFSSVSASCECPDFPAGELPAKVRASLLNAGVDLFYIFADVSANSDEVTKMRKHKKGITIKARDQKFHARPFLPVDENGEPQPGLEQILLSQVED